MEVANQLVPVVESATTKSPDESAWLNELPAELDDCIAHRDMEHAVVFRNPIHIAWILEKETYEWDRIKTADSEK